MVNVMELLRGPKIDRAEIDRRRFRRAMRFFRASGLNIVWWEIILRRIFGEDFVAPGRDERTRRYAREFRAVAIEMGGVMIKMGQFLSARVDVMPDSLIEELAGLQDEVPPEPNDSMMEVLRQELGRPCEEVFASIDPQPRGAASFGQVYRARLHNGDRVAVKIQRPNIERTVVTDLAALRIVSHWLMAWPLIAKRANVPNLLEEFAVVLWEELDYYTELDNADHFWSLFADNLSVYIPAVYPEFSTRRILVMEDVTSIKITDVNAIREAGIDPEVLARRLLDSYLEMFFSFGFFHADPHPGNLFVYPLPDQAARRMYGNRGPGHPGTPFYLIFIDFGMCGRITQERRRGMREMVIAMGTRDVKKLLSALQTLKVLLPSEHLTALEAAAEETFDLIWGKSPKELAAMDNSEMEAIAHKYRKLLFDLPFQVPQDFIYIGRAVGILSGLCTAIDPAFDPWASTADSARKLITRDMFRSGEAVTATIGLVGEVLKRVRGA